MSPSDPPPHPRATRDHFDDGAPIHQRDRIQISGLRYYGYTGLEPAERELGH